jgi:hypothetical protein
MIIFRHIWTDIKEQEGGEGEHEQVQYKSELRNLIFITLVSAIIVNSIIIVSSDLDRSILLLYVDLI